MDEHVDQAKGKIKEKVGEMIGDRDLENEGKVDQAKGKVKEAVENVKDAVRKL